MIQDELYPLIHLAERGRPERGRVHVHLNGQGKATAATGAAGLIGKVLGGGFTYDILLDQWVEIYDASRLLRTFLSNEETSVDFRIKLSVTSRNAEKVAEALHDRHRSPSEVLLDEVRRALKTLIESSQHEGPETVSQRLFTYRRSWQETIVNRLEDRLGVSAEIIFEVPPPVLTRDFRVEDFMVRLKDALHRSVPMTLVLKLAPTTDRAVDTFPTDRDRQQRLLRDVIQETAINDVTLFDYWFDQAAVERAIQLRLDAVCRHYAYRVSQVSLKPQAAPVLRGEHLAVELPWQGHRGRPVVFQVDADMRLDRDGAGLYDALGSPDRRDWLRGRCEAAVRVAMHNRDFYDLTLAEQDHIEGHVRQILQDEAARIGHGIETVIARVRLPENRWLDRQMVEIDVDRYRTKSSPVQAEISATLDIRFSTIRPLIDHVDQRSRGGVADYDARIEEELRAFVRQSLRAAISHVDASDYFAEWEAWTVPFDEDDSARPRNDSRSELVRAALTREVVRDIKARLSPDSVRLRLVRHDTDYLLIGEAVARLGDFVIRGTVSPDGARSSDLELPYEIFVRPNRIRPDRLAEMLQRGVGALTAPRVEASLGHAAEEFLGRRSRDELDDLNVGVLAGSGGPAIKVQLEAHLGRVMADRYGFDVVVERARVLRSEAERFQRDFDAEETRVARVQYEARWAYLADHADDRRREAESLRAMIAGLNRRLLDNPRANEKDIEDFNRDERLLAEAEEKLRRTAGTAAEAIAGRLADRRTEPAAIRPPTDTDAGPAAPGGPVIDAEAEPPTADDDLDARHL